MDRRVTPPKRVTDLHGVPHLFFGYEFPMRVIAKKTITERIFWCLVALVRNMSKGVFACVSICMEKQGFE